MTNKPKREKRKTFWNNQDGFTKEDFEKLTTGMMFTLMVLAVAYKFLFDEFVVTEILTFTAGLGGLFVARKAFSYFKSDSYYEHNENYNKKKNKQSENEDSADNNTVG